MSTVSDNWRTLMHRDGHTEARPSKQWEDARADTVRAAEAAERGNIEHAYAEKVQALERQLAAVAAYGREHKFVSYRQADNARRAVRALHRSDAPMP